MLNKFNFKKPTLVSLIILLSYIIVIITVSVKSVEMAKGSAFELTDETANRYGTYVKAEIEVAMDSARTLTRTFESMKISGITDREVMNNILKHVLKDNPHFIAIWACWEPNALDGKDNEFINMSGHDSTGRFIPYWNRFNNKLDLEPLYDYETPGSGDYYLIPKNTKSETIIEPYWYPIAGNEVLLTSLVVPIICEEKFLGVVGIDITLNTFQELISGIKPFQTGYASLISNNGQYVAHNSEQIGQYLEDAKAKEAIKLGKTYTSINSDFYRVFVPINIGNTTTPWSIALSVPMDVILQKANEIRNFLIIITLISLFLIIKLINLLVKQSDYEEQKLKFKQTKEINRVLREQRHDFLNHIQVIDGYLELSMIGELTRYLTELKGSMKTPDISIIVPDQEISYFLATKLMYAKELGIKVHTNINATLPIEKTSSFDFVRVIGNLIDNAIYELKTLPTEERVLNLISTNKEHNVILEIFNNGIIVPEDIQSLIFDPGYTTKGVEGDGMGLSIVKKIVEEKYRGSITMESNEEIGGTKFIISIPVNNTDKKMIS